jgi:hypothetical protein
MNEFCNQDNKKGGTHGHHKLVDFVIIYKKIQTTRLNFFETSCLI